MRNVLFLLLFVTAMIVGCSGGGNPVAPMNDEKSNDNVGTQAGSLDSIPIIGLTSSEDGSFNSLGLMGAYELSIDQEKMTAELVSKRIPTLGESYIVSGINFFTLRPCADCVKIKKVALTSENYLQLTFEVRHPFKAGNPLEPPSGINRLDLDVFDPALVLRPLAGWDEISWPLMGGKTPKPFLANADGYTPELSGMLGGNTSLPYVLIVDEEGVADSHFNRLPMGGTANVDAIFHMDGAMNFEMYLTMGYGASAKGKNQRLTPTYFNPEFNRKSAWKLIVIPPEGTDPPSMANTWNDIDSITTRAVTVKIFDWQSGVSSIRDPLVDKGDILSISDVKYMSVEIPGMTDTLQSWSLHMGGTGTPVDPLIYKVGIRNENLLPAGEYLSLVKVVDMRVPQPIPPLGKYDFLINEEANGLLKNYAIPEFATYQTFIATVVSGHDSIPPVWDSTTGITGATTGTCQVTVSWGTAQDVRTPPVEYLVYKDTDNNPWDQTPVVRTDNTPYVFTGLTYGQPYWFGVRCRDSAVPPNVDTNTVVMSATPIDTTPPTWNSTTGVTSVTGQCKQLTVNWGTATDSCTPPVSYLIYYDTDSNPWDRTPIVRTTNTPYAITGLTNGTPYWVGVRCRDNASPANTDANTVVMSATPVDSVPPTWDSTTGVTSVTSEYKQLTVNWGTATDSCTPPVSYVIYCDTDSNPWDQTPIVRANNTPYAITGLTNGTPYWIGVRCRDSASTPNVDTNMATIISRPSGFIWGNGFGSSSADYADCVGTDSSGNVYIAGYTNDSLYGTNAGTFDLFLCKYDASGLFQWGRQIGSTGAELCRDIEVDSSGNCYLAGEAMGGNLFNPGFGVYEYIIWKYDSNGTFAWGKRLGSGGTTKGNAVAYDSSGSGSVYIAGFTTGSLFNANSGNYDIFLARYDTSGNLQWGRNWGTSLSEEAQGCTADNGYVYLTGYTMGSLYSINQGSSDIFICKYSSAYELQWETQFGTTGTEAGENIALGSSSDIYIVGYTNGALYDPYSGSQDIFLCKYNTSGAFQWGHNWGTSADDTPYSVSVDSSSNVNITGYSNGSLYSTNNGARDIFFCRYNSSGTSLFGRSYGGSLSENGTGIASYNSGYFYIVGYAVSNPLDLDPDSGVYNLIIQGNSDFFISKFYFE